MNPHEAKRLCDNSLKRSRRRRMDERLRNQIRQEWIAALTILAALVVSFAILTALKGWAIW